MGAAGSTLAVTVNDALVPTADHDGAEIIPRARLVLPLDNGAQQRGASALYPIRGLPGVLSAPLARMKLVVAAVDCNASAAQLLQAASAAWDEHSGSPTIGLVADGASPVEQAAALGALWPEAVIAPHSAARALALIATRADAFDILLVPASVAALFASAGAALSGTRRCAARVITTESAVYFEDVSDSTDQDPDPSGLILAAAALMRRAGERRAAERLANAWLRTLEDGLHTRELGHVSPYSRCLTPAAFADAVAERIGERPRRLAPVEHPGPASRSGAVLSICR
jgi:hypothetical protein